MNERLAKIQEKMQRGEPVIGIFVLLADAAVSEMAGYAGCDFVWIDSEHGLLGRQGQPGAKAGTTQAGAKAGTAQTGRTAPAAGSAQSQAQGQAQQR